MKVFSVIGITQSGKTTTIEKIIKELIKRGYTVGTVKQIHFHSFKMDVEGTNTDRHKKAGSSLVTARGEFETDVLYQEKISIDKILKAYSHDYVVMEGVRDTDAPKIVTAHDADGIAERFDDTVFAISGRVSNMIKEYNTYPVINSLTDIEKLVDLIEEKVPDKRYDLDEYKTDIKLKIDGQEIFMAPFVQNILKNSVEAVVKELDGYKQNGEIEICIKKYDS